MSNSVSGNFGDYVPTVEQYMQRALHASAVVGDWVYIDGGELLYQANQTISNGGLNQSSIFPTTMQELLNKTLALDMRSSWTNSTVKFHTSDRSGAPLLNRAVLWLDAQSQSFYKWAGALSWWVVAPDFSTDLIPQPALWKFTPDNNGGGSWSEPTPDGTFPIVQPEAGVSMSGQGVGYYFGGQLDDGTYPYTSINAETPVSGLTEFDSTSNTWSNQTAPTIPEGGIGIWGGGYFVPTFGKDGLVVFFGTAPPGKDVFANVTSANNMSTINVFDPSSSTWFSQVSQGPALPLWRGRFCTTGVAGDNGTYEIFIHGGTQFPTASLSSGEASQYDASELQLDAVYILSLPSFTWWQPSYSPIQSRFDHTCHVVGPGQSQMLTIGGQDFTGERDVFAQGLGIFDMNALAWSNQYNKDAANYTTPSMIKDHIAVAGPTPSQWNNPALGGIFEISRAATATPTPPPKHSSDAGAIAGGVVGGIVVLLLLLLGIFFFRRRKRRQGTGKEDERMREVDRSTDRGRNRSQEKRRSPDRPPPRNGEDLPLYGAESGGQEWHELPAIDRRSELSGPNGAQAWEMDAGNKPVELDGVKK